MHCTHKSAGIVIPDGLRVSESFQERIRFQDDVLHALERVPKANQNIGRKLIYLLFIYYNVL